jgi:hypothetical protein
MSQSKGLTLDEVKNYRQEIYDRFSSWSEEATRDHLLNFLASRITLEDIANAVVEVASQVYFYGPRYAHDVLTWPEVLYSEKDSLLNHQIVLDKCALWGLLSYEEEMNYDNEGNYQNTLLVVNHKPVCQKLAAIIAILIEEKGEENWDLIWWRLTSRRARPAFDGRSAWRLAKVAWAERRSQSIRQTA